METTLRRVMNFLTHGVLRIALGLVLLGATLPHAASASAPPPDLAKLIERLMPMVVNISTFHHETAPAGITPATTAAAVVRRRMSLGSGFIIDPSGIIATNKHVIADAEEITVTLHDGTMLSAKLLSTAAHADIAMLKVNAPGPLQAVIYGDSDKVQQGDTVIAIGNPLGFGGTVTAGIVSALDRDIRSGPLDSYIQVDAAINHGNSGGPLFNDKGELIGMNTALLSPTDEGGSIGIGFAIPSNDAQFVLRRLRQYGRVRSGWIGAEGQTMTEALAEATGTAAGHGVMVTGLTPGAPAMLAGIHIGDVILKLGFWDITNARVFARAAAVQPIGGTVPVTLWRDSHEITMDVGIVEWPDEAEGAHGMAAASAHFMRPVTPDFGLTLTPLTTQTRPTFSLGAFDTGVLVTAVVGNSDAADEGVLPGDVIVMANGKRVATAAEVWRDVERARAADRRRVLLLLQTPSGAKFVALPFREVPLGCGSQSCLDAMQKPAVAGFVR